MTLDSSGRTGRFTFDLPVVALSLAALAHWIRGATADALIFLVVTLALLLTERFWTEESLVAQPFQVPWPSIAAAALLVLAFGRDSVPVGVAISAIGVAALVTQWRDPSLPADRPVPPRAWLWSAVGLSWCLWELISFIFEQAAGGLSLTHPTMSDLVDPLLASRFAQAAAITGWLAAGLAMLRASDAARRT